MTTQPNYLRGIDVSHYNGTIKFNLVKSAGIIFAFAKATEGTSYRDAKFKDNWKAMKDAGIIRGAYHYFIPSDDASQQASHFIETVELQPGDLPPVLDVESAGNDQQVLINGVKTWLEVVEKQTGYKPIIYTSPSFWNSNMTDQFGAYPLWIANYKTGAPTIPSGWTQWNFWQYSNSGSINGVTGSVDLDYFNGSATNLQSLTISAPANSQSLVTSSQNLTTVTTTATKSSQASDLSKTITDFLPASTGTLRRLLTTLFGSLSAALAGIAAFIKSEPVISGIIIIVAILVLAWLISFYIYCESNLDHKRIDVAADPEKNNAK
ncbi:MAG: glycoside hydrolase family 25 protein [Acidobacteriota bacterium]